MRVHRSSNRFIAIWRNTVAIWPSRLSASNARRASGSAVSSSNRPNVTVSPNTDAVSARVSGVRLVEDPLLPCKVRVETVAQLVRERRARRADSTSS